MEETEDQRRHWEERPLFLKIGRPNREKGMNSRLLRDGRFTSPDHGLISTEIVFQTEDKKRLWDGGRPSLTLADHPRPREEFSSAIEMED